MENPMNKWDDLGGKPPLFLVQHPYVGGWRHLKVEGSETETNTRFCD